jgi:hypothetical protein
MQPAPSILWKVPSRSGTPLVQAPVQRLLDPSRPPAVLGAVQLRTQGLLDYLAVTLLKTW